MLRGVRGVKLGKVSRCLLGSHQVQRPLSIKLRSLWCLRPTVTTANFRLPGLRHFSSEAVSTEEAVANEPKRLDWTCLACVTTNFGWRDQCRNCGADNPNPPVYREVPTAEVEVQPVQEQDIEEMLEPEEKLYPDLSENPEVLALQLEKLALKGKENANARKEKTAEIVNAKRRIQEPLIGEEKDGLPQIGDWLFSKPASELAKETTLWEMEMQDMKLKRWQLKLHRQTRNFRRGTVKKRNTRKLAEKHGIEREKIDEIKYYLNYKPGQVAYQNKVWPHRQQDAGES
mmetsp:Transcript_39282/g.77263  ORF Transcript_39282/g.77263 Transcript_39282/m.77263 type:complete len:287 (+) Transcript_39282:28-888(+)